MTTPDDPGSDNDRADRDSEPEDQEDATPDPDEQGVIRPGELLGEVANPRPDPKPEI